MLPAVDAAASLVNQLDADTVRPSDDLLEAVADLNGALARWARRNGIELRAVSAPTKKQP